MWQKTIYSGYRFSQMIRQDRLGAIIRIIILDKFFNIFKKMTQAVHKTGPCNLFPIFLLFFGNVIIVFPDTEVPHHLSRSIVPNKPIIPKTKMIFGSIVLGVTTRSASDPIPRKLLILTMRLSVEKDVISARSFKLSRVFFLFSSRRLSCRAYTSRSNPTVLS
jgi:hypothetical protein